MAYSEAQKKATLKYRKEHLETFSLQMRKGLKAEYKAQAAEHGMSLNAYIISLLERDKKETL